MDYPVSQLQFSRYMRLIEWAKQNPPDGRVEKHHIVPRSMGGSNRKENLVPLSPRWHFIAHWLLWKAYKNSKMANAFWTMACCNGIKLNSKTYAAVRNNAVKAIAQSKIGKTTSEKQKETVRRLMTGKVFSEETRQKISLAKKGKKLSAEHIAKLVVIKTGKTASAETKAKMSLAKKGKKPNNWLGYKSAKAVTPPLPWAA
jgi:5-methylcytosine-specific restriction endonuclease McrA